jgi:hypothetical protein
MTSHNVCASPASPRSCHFQSFNIAIRRRSRSWWWTVFDEAGAALIRGRERSRAAARYRSARALFILLLHTRAIVRNRLTD